MVTYKIGFRFFTFEKFLEHRLLAALGTHFTQALVVSYYIPIYLVLEKQAKLKQSFITI